MYKKFGSKVMQFTRIIKKSGTWGFFRIFLPEFQQHQNPFFSAIVQQEVKKLAKWMNIIGIVMQYKMYTKIYKKFGSKVMQFPKIKRKEKIRNFGNFPRIWATPEHIFFSAHSARESSKIGNMDEHHRGSPTRRYLFSREAIPAEIIRS